MILVIFIADLIFQTFCKIIQNVFLKKVHSISPMRLPGVRRHDGCKRIRDLGARASTRIACVHFVCYICNMAHNTTAKLFGPPLLHHWSLTHTKIFYSMDSWIKIRIGGRIGVILKCYADCYCFATKNILKILLSYVQFRYFF